MSKPILVIDFDGVLHSYASGWRGATTIADPPTPGMVKFLRAAVDKFDVQILSSRSKEPGGISAMRNWLTEHVEKYYDRWITHGRRQDFDSAQEILSQVKFPTEKPAAFLTIDDRAICFDGTWPSINELMEFKPWNKRTASDGSTAAGSRNVRLTQTIRKVLTLIARRARSTGAG